MGCVGKYLLEADEQLQDRCGGINPRVVIGSLIIKHMCDLGDRETVQPVAVAHPGQLIVDATACPQDNGFLTDLNLLDNAREKSEELIDVLYSAILHKKKPGTYRKVARRMYLKTA